MLCSVTGLAEGYEGFVIHFVWVMQQSVFSICRCALSFNCSSSTLPAAQTRLLPPLKELQLGGVHAAWKDNH